MFLICLTLWDRLFVQVGQERLELSRYCYFASVSKTEMSTSSNTAPKMFVSPNCRLLSVSLAFVEARVVETLSFGCKPNIIAVILSPQNR